jgi:hypothetical protein
MSLRSTLCTASGCKLRVAPAGFCFLYTQYTAQLASSAGLPNTMRQEYSLLAEEEADDGCSPLLKITDSVRGELCFVLSVILQDFISYWDYVMR